MLVLVGQVDTESADREAFQEIDYRRMFGSVAKWAAQVDRAERIPEYLSRAFVTAMSGRPGPVVLALPEDVLATRAVAADLPRASPVDIRTGRGRRASGSRAPRERRPPAGAGRRQPVGRRRLCRADRVRRAPCSPGRLRFPSTGPVRQPPSRATSATSASPSIRRWPTRIRDADVLLVIGERLGEITTTGYTLPVGAAADAGADPRPPRRRGARPRVPARGRDRRHARGVRRGTGEASRRSRRERWRASTAAAHADYEAWRAPRPVPGDVDLWQVVRWLDERLPDDAILANGAGNYTTWLHRVYRYRRPGTQLAPYSGSMGYGVPAAIAAKLVHPERIVVSWNGDGCFLMNGQELATAVQYGAGVVFVVIDNGMYGTIRMHQERRYPDRVVGSGLANPGLRRARASVRRARRDGAAHRRVRAGLRACARRRAPGAAPRAAGPAGADDERDARFDPHGRRSIAEARHHVKRPAAGPAGLGRHALRVIARAASCSWRPPPWAA